MRLAHLIACGLSLTLTGVFVSLMGQYDRQWDSWLAAKAQLNKNEERIADLICTEDGLRQAPAHGVDPFASVRGIYKDPQFAEGDAYVGGLPTRLKKLTPLVPSDLYQRLVESCVEESLLTRDPQTLAWQPYIAKAWQVSPDGLTISFDLREGVVFSDGHPLTSADVVYTFDKIQSPDTDCPDLKALMDKVVSCRAEGPYRVVYRLSEPYFLSLEMVGGMTILAKHWYSQFTPSEFNEKPGLLFGSGPYRLEGDPKAWKSGGGVTLVRNPWFWGPRPPLDKIVLREYQTTRAREVDFGNGVIDSLAISPDKFPQYQEELAKPDGLSKIASLHRYMTLDGGYSYIGWNERWGGKPSPFADKRVRQAMTLLIDRERIVRDIFNGIGQVVSGPFGLTCAQSDPGVKPWPYDPEKAKALLEEAGWEDRDGNGILEDQAGKEFRFNLMYPAGSEGTDRQMQFVRDGLRRAGVLMTLEPLDFPVLITRLGSRDFQACSLGWGGSVETDPRQIFHTVAIQGGDNSVNYSNPKLDVLIDKARVEMDETKRNAIWHECHRLLHEDQPYTFLYSREALSLISRRFHGVEDPKVGFYNYTSWFVPKAEQKH